MVQEFSDHVVYVDESGDHSLTAIDSDYPVFVLAFCIFRKEDYCRNVVPGLQDLKFRHFGHDMVVLHERAIRKRSGDFSILMDRTVRHAFMDEMNALVEEAPFTLIASVIDKRALKDRYRQPDNPYHLALSFCLERLWMYLNRRASTAGRLHVVFEGRGRREDRDLELEFRRVCDGGNYSQDKLPFEIVIADKRVNSSGLQLADLVARPIGRHVLDRRQPNRAFEVLKTKFDRQQERLKGYGLKIFP